MNKFKMRLLYNEEEIFCTITKLLSFKITLPVAKSDMVGSRLVSIGLVFSGNILIDFQLFINFFYCCPMLVK